MSGKNLYTMVRPKTQTTIGGSQFRISAGSYNGIPFGAILNKDVRKVVQQPSAERIQIQLQKESGV